MNIDYNETKRDETKGEDDECECNVTLATSQLKQRSRCLIGVIIYYLYHCLPLPSRKMTKTHKARCFILNFTYVYMYYF